jgi:hypothetical protein
MQLRFSLRWLLILTALVAVACYWWIARPTMLAKCFVAAITFEEYYAADQLCLDPNRRFVIRALYQFQGEIPYWAGPYMLWHSYVVEGRVLPRSWSDLCCGMRRVEMTIRDNPLRDDKPPSIDLGGRQIGLRIDTFQLTATPWSIHPPIDAGYVYFDRRIMAGPFHPDPTTAEE